MMFKLIKSVLIIIVLVLMALFYVSPQETPPFLDESGAVITDSISEIRDIEINGIKQRVLIRGKNRSNPVLLHLHGGPGGPDRPLMDKNKNLEDIFTICYWDQRGAGASYSDDIPVETMKQKQIIDDGIEVSKYLLKQFGKKKIYLEAHSWGTLFGIQMVFNKPDLFHAYIGIAQNSDSLMSEQLSYDFVKESAQKAQDNETLEVLKTMGRPPYANDDWVKNVSTERQLLKKYEGPIGKEKLSKFSIYRDFVLYREYSIADKLKALKGSPFSLKHLWPEAKATNLFEKVTEFKVPIYIIQGKYDMTTVTSISKKYFDTIQAPKKEYYELQNSAHWPHITEFEKYKSIIREIVKAD